LQPPTHWKPFVGQSKVSRTFPNRTFLVDATLGKNVLVENTTLQQLFPKKTIKV